MLRRSVTCQDVKGVLACRDGRWAVDNESEVRMLAALGADCGGALDRFQALVATLNVGLVDASGLRQLNARLRQIAAAPEEELAIEWHDRDLMAQAAFACVCLPLTSHRNAPGWLAWALSARLEENLVRGSFPGPGWLTLKSRHRYRGWGFDRDTCWIPRLPREFWTRLKSHPQQVAARRRVGERSPHDAEGAQPAGPLRRGGGAGSGGIAPQHPGQGPALPGEVRRL